MSVMSYDHITRSKIKSLHSKIKDWHQLLQYFAGVSAFKCLKLLTMEKVGAY